MNLRTLTVNFSVARFLFSLFRAISRSQSSLLSPKSLSHPPRCSLTTKVSAFEVPGDLPPNQNPPTPSRESCRAWTPFFYSAQNFFLERTMVVPAEILSLNPTPCIRFKLFCTGEFPQKKCRHPFARTLSLPLTVRLVLFDFAASTPSLPILIVLHKSLAVPSLIPGLCDPRALGSLRSPRPTPFRKRHSGDSS